MYRLETLNSPQDTGSAQTVQKKNTKKLKKKKISKVWGCKKDEAQRCQIM